MAWLEPALRCLARGGHAHATNQGHRFWGSTAFTALALGATGVADLLRVPVIMEGLAHLGYPPYFATILGT